VQEESRKAQIAAAKKMAEDEERHRARERAGGVQFSSDESDTEDAKVDSTEEAKSPPPTENPKL